MQINSSSEFNPNSSRDYFESGLQSILSRLYRTIERDTLVCETVNKLRESLQANRVVLYYFYDRWHGQVTFEALSSPNYSILGSTGADGCFNDEYAALYLAGRVRVIDDIETESITECHRDFLRNLRVRANLVVPILIPKGLWGLLVAHDEEPRIWLRSHVELMQLGASVLATSPCILDTGNSSDSTITN
ncbi:MAG: GAF domain-containing protein [Methylacidiphilales bacterium]|nr:GAF domain-containing protein [Candidatus Methylacidiphilales bacterium]NJR14984.1 GAF domain-containing protein [Calothrix sp. CSU_2_0]